MKGSVTKSSLSAPRRRLLEAMQRLNFGRIEGLAVRDGQPVFDPSPRLIRDIKFGCENGPRPELDAPDFALRIQVIELFDHLSQVGNGTIDTIEVKYGLPFRMIVAQAA